MMDESTSHTRIPRETDRRALLAGIGGLAAGTFLSAGRAEAGSLIPPGAPSPTAKPLADIEPRIAIDSTNTPGDGTNLFIISKPGSYYLPRNIEGRAGRNGILIAADNVAIDLMGFTLEGVAGSLHGIAVNMPRENLSICNGIVRNWGGHGIDLGPTGSSGSMSRLENLQSTDNGLFGIRASRNSLLRGCAASRNGDIGIIAGDEAVVESCQAEGNNSAGIQVGLASTIVGCTAIENAGIGIILGGSSAVTSCVARRNSSVGIFAPYCAVSNCFCYDNFTDGINVTGSGVAFNCSSLHNGGIGIRGVEICNCNAQENVGAGFALSSGGFIRNCTASGNASHGITVASGCIVRDCVIRLNGFQDTGDGIRLTGSDNRIEGNNCSGNRIGIHVVGAGNFIAGNTCSGNSISNWDVAANNKCLVINGGNAGAFSGDSGGMSPGSTNPNANYTF